MGITFHARFEKSKGVDSFDLNNWGADIFGALHAACGAKLANGISSNDPDKLDWNWVTPRVPFQATATRAREMAWRLKEKRDVWELVYNKWVRPYFGPLEEFVAWVEEWVSFLETCGGYRSI